MFSLDYLWCHSSATLCWRNTMPMCKVANILKVSFDFRWRWGMVKLLCGSYFEWFIAAALWPQKIIAARSIQPTICTPINKMEMKDFIIAFHYCVPEVHTTNWERNEFPHRCQPWVTSFVPDKDIPQSLYLFFFFFFLGGLGGLCY